MTRKLTYLLLVLIALVAGFSLGYQRARVRSVPGRQALYYVDPMHPAYRSARPGVAPDCGMQLVAVYAEDAAGALERARRKPGVAHVDAATRQLYGIATSRAEWSTGHGTVRAFGRVAADETRVYQVNMGVDGFVRETDRDAVGNHVRKDQHLALVYSPEFLSVAGGFLSANERTPGNAPKDNTAPTPNAASSAARADRLRMLGMSDAQIAEVSATRKIPEDVYVVAPADGFIMARNISPGARFERHAELYRIADLSHVWVLAETFGGDAQAFHSGALARVTQPDTGQSFTARVSNVLPTVDPVTRALKQRLELDNPGFRLRPEMFVNVELAVAAPRGLTVPAEAVVDSGRTKRVFVEDAEGDFEARDVETGWTAGDRVEIVKGLHAGETVVSAGTFLIDSETRMRQGAEMADAAKGTPRREMTALNRRD